MASIQSFCDQARKIPLLTPDREAQIVDRIKRLGDTEARNELVRSHIPLAISMAHALRRVGRFEDVVSEAIESLFKAAEGYSPEASNGKPFAYYAKFWIRAAIYKHAASVRTSVGSGSGILNPSRFYTFVRERRKLSAEMGETDACKDKLAALLGMSRQEVDLAIARIDSVDSPISPHLCDRSGPSPEDLVMQAELLDDLREQISLAVGRLTDRERDVVRLRYDVGLSQTEAARECGFSRQRAEQLERSALGKLRKLMYLEDHKAA